MTVTTEKFFSSCKIFASNVSPNCAISDQRFIFVIKSMSVMPISSSKLISEMQLPLISLPFIDELTVIEQAAKMAQPAQMSEDPSSVKVSET